MNMYVFSANVTKRQFNSSRSARIQYSEWHDRYEDAVVFCILFFGRFLLRKFYLVETFNLKRISISFFLFKL